MKISLLNFCLFLFFIPARSQTLNQADTSLIFSITIFNKADSKNQTKFPDVYPDISSIKLISNNDTILCTYDFPFLTLDKQHFLHIASNGNLVMLCNYDHLTTKSNSRFSLEIPIKFPLSYKGAKFILVEQDVKNRFYQMQKWGTTIYKGTQIKSKRIY